MQEQDRGSLFSSFGAFRGLECQDFVERCVFYGVDFTRTKIKLPEHPKPPT